MLRCASSRVLGASFRQSVLQSQPAHHIPRSLFGRSANNTSQIPTDEAASEQPQAGENGQSAADVKAIEEKYSAELEKSEKAFKEVQDQLRRCLAETENVRKRSEKQVADSKLFGIQRFAKDLLDVADILEKAVDASPVTKDKSKCSPELVSMHEGLALTSSQLQKVFATNGLVRQSPLGEEFDPNCHEALFKIPQAAAEGKKAGAVGTVARVGYALNNRTLRAAQVGVVSE